MMTDRAIMQQALEALEGIQWPGSPSFVKAAIDALRTRLAQPERVQLTVRDFVVTVGGIEDAVGTPTYWAEWPNKEGY
jgi:hypothetical protein